MTEAFPCNKQVIFFFEKSQIAPFLAKSIAYVGQKVDSFLIVWPHCI